MELGGKTPNFIIKREQMKRTPLSQGKKGLKRTALSRGPVGLNRMGSLQRKSALARGDSKLEKTPLRKQSLEAKEKWEEARKLALLRDGGKCQVCGMPATQVHHIHLRSNRHDLLYNLNNLISLCDQHHFHSANDRYVEQNELIAKKKRITVEELLWAAEQPMDDKK